MEMKTELPFRVGQLAETRSFQTGYRGSWFRCTIRRIINKGQKYLLEFYDFPDEKLNWTNLHQLPPYCLEKAIQKNKELMLRPCYPRTYNQNKMPHDGDFSEVAVVSNNVWQVGDLVDWWTTDCFWSGRILQLLDDGKAQIELNPPPFGEGGIYEVLLQDVRPSLDWSPEKGWMVPTQDGDTGHRCTKLIRHLNQDTQVAVQQADRPSESSINTSFSSLPSSRSAEKSTETTKMQKQLESTVSNEVTDMGTRAELASSDASYGESGVTVPDEELDSMCCESAETAVLELEEYLNKVKWLKAILLKGVSSSDAPRPQWDFVDKNLFHSHRRST